MALVPALAANLLVPYPRLSGKGRRGSPSPGAGKSALTGDKRNNHRQEIPKQKEEQCGIRGSVAGAKGPAGQQRGTDTADGYITCKKEQTSILGYIHRRLKNLRSVKNIC